MRDEAGPPAYCMSLTVEERKSERLDTRYQLLEEYWVISIEERMKSIRQPSHY